jgi:hypothetical protein
MSFAAGRGLCGMSKVRVHISVSADAHLACLTAQGGGADWMAAARAAGY